MFFFFFLGLRCDETAGRPAAPRQPAFKASPQPPSLGSIPGIIVYQRSSSSLYYHYHHHLLLLLLLQGSASSSSGLMFFRSFTKSKEKARNTKKNRLLFFFSSFLLLLLLLLLPLLSQTGQSQSLSSSPSSSHPLILSPSFIFSLRCLSPLASDPSLSLCPAQLQPTTSPINRPPKKPLPLPA
ncbi:uncharacterized protein ARB_03045 [Trichophyton benhamiae CBS 112371]|uniref:Uncharacterized protein n=1 Tax=Arthroderma benhamiae (strain ATCC MYA-4681 / CBS 112371) TaxID=663331 RepID=D4B3K6_ARTBC|nr:uncharacterized protein ARB_03045 [Trichophyton benhamiae CBS 112371]EFE29704.1 hypothetical protein ARB_03045 [Trichophyton benhamiae CBS 112371]